MARFKGYIKGNKVENPNKVLARIIGIILKRYWHLFIILILGILGSALATVKGTVFMQTLIDDYIIPLTKMNNPDFSSLGKALMHIATIYLFGIVCNLLFQKVKVYISQGTLRNLRIEIFNKMQSLPIKYFDTHAHGDIMSIYTNDVDTLRQLISQSIPQLLNSGISAVSVFVSMIILDVPLTVVTVLMILLMLKVSRIVGGKSGKYFMEQQKDLGKVNGYIEEMISGQKVVKVFCRENECINEFKKLNDELRESAYSANKFANILMPINANIGNISFVLCAIIGAVLALSGFSSITLGAIVAFLTLNKSINGPIIQVSQQINSIAMAMAGADRIFKLLDEEPEVDEGLTTLVNVRERNGELIESNERTNAWAWKKPDGTLVKLEGGVVFDDVDFGYDDKKIVLHNIKLFAEPGQKIAFVGSTGAGKTTITNLINRFYDIQDGKIRYDGININHIKKFDLRSSLGIVLQDTHLFTGTVLENIRFGRLNATDSECKEAARLANAHSFITRLPDGYNTVITGDGSNLSQGQRQLLAIARAAVADPPVLILDEATSSIDTRTEGLVQRGMDSLMKGRTTFVIAHRLSTVKNADCIMVLENGRIIERGNHDELIDKKGRYYQLYTGNLAEN